MTDLSPKDLSHLSDKEFNALCPQGYHAPGPAEPLSPAAQAVMDAIGCPDPESALALVARGFAAVVLRAAADQAVPKDDPSSFIPGAPRSYAVQRRTTRAELLAIAAELEGKR